MKQCWIQYIEEKKIQKNPPVNYTIIFHGIYKTAFAPGWTERGGMN
jgi:hypothetical protein